MKKRSILFWLTPLAAFFLFTRASCFPPDVPVCIDWENCPKTPLVQEVDPETKDTLTEVIVQVYPGLDTFDLLGPPDTLYGYPSLNPKDNFSINWLNLTAAEYQQLRSPQGAYVPDARDTLLIGHAALVADLNNFLYDSALSTIDSLLPVDTCKCDKAIFLMQAQTPEGVDINNGIAKGKSQTREDNKGAIQAAGFNYNIDLKPFNEAELASEVASKSCPASQPPTPRNDGKPRLSSGVEAKLAEMMSQYNPNTCGSVRPGTELTEEAVNVAMIDTGVDPTYRYPTDRNGDLVDYFWFSPEMDFFGQDPISTNYGGPWPGNGVDNGAGCFPDDYYGYDFFHDDNNPSDRKGHGTHMAYTILTANQPNQKPVRIMPLQFGGYREDEFSCDLFSGICAINYATKTKEDMKVDVMNLSWGFYSRIFHDVLYEQMLKTQEAEIVVVTSAGNDFVLVDNCYHWPSGYSQVEELENVISVAALAYFNSPDDYALSSYSNYGMDVDLAAPGTEILGALVGTFNDKTRLDGTSMAAAVVSRRIAMLRYDQQNGMPIPAKELKQLLLTQETRLLDRACIDGRRMLDPLIDPTLLDAIGY